MNLGIFGNVDFWKSVEYTRVFTFAMQCNSVSISDRVVSEKNVS